MRGITFHLDDKEEARRDKIGLTNREIFLLGVDTAERSSEIEALAPVEERENSIKKEI